MLFQQDNTRPYTAAATHCVLRVIQQLPCAARSPDLSPIEHVRDMIKRELFLFPEPATTITELRQRVSDAWYNPSQDDIRHLYDRFHVRLHACIAASGGTLCIFVLM